jgi:4-alpha-glucanotransferase
MPTIRGFWLGRDIAWRRRLGLYPDDAAAETETAERRRDRLLLLEALADEGLIGRERFREFFSDGGEPLFSPSLAEAVLAFLARSEARLMLVQLDDILGESEQANLPGTTEGHPNWRRRSSRSLEEIADDPRLGRAAALIAVGRRAGGWSEDATKGAALEHDEPDPVS